jgi:hypothetical protein
MLLPLAFEKGFSFSIGTKSQSVEPREVITGQGRRDRIAHTPRTAPVDINKGILRPSHQIDRGDYLKPFFCPKKQKARLIYKSGDTRTNIRPEDGAWPACERELGDVLIEI